MLHVALFAKAIQYIYLFMRFKYLAIHVFISVSPQSLQNTTLFPRVLQSYEAQKKKQKSALNQTGGWYVRGGFVSLVVSDLSVVS